ncbi:MAG: hypothetical protein WC856_28975, partial [Methylococcaceae bacterium]
PICLQGSIPGSWLAITWTGFPPASLCSIARPQRLINPFKGAHFPKDVILYAVFSTSCTVSADNCCFALCEYLRQNL